MYKSNWNADMDNNEINKENGFEKELHKIKRRKIMQKSEANKNLSEGINTKIILIIIY